MRYQRVRWQHTYTDEPVDLYSESDDEGWETRKVEVFADGSMTLADDQTSTGNTFLAEVPMPAMEEIARDPQFQPSPITREEFEVVWQKARAARQPRPLRKAQ
jgi:hypothetical protein